MKTRLSQDNGASLHIDGCSFKILFLPSEKLKGFLNPIN